MSTAPSVDPEDRHDTTLLANVHPREWSNPQPEPVYNLVVIGGGTAGLVSAGGAGLLGAKVALVERSLLGGDCLNTGCVPSKSIIRSARAAADVARAGVFGVRVAAPPRVDFQVVMERLRRVRSEISHHDSVERLHGLGVQVFLGQARFADRNTVVVGDLRLRFKKAVIATGASPLIPAIPGLEQVGYLTNETVFNLKKLPRRLMIVGGGPLGCELAQTFARLGSRVTMVETLPRFLSREDPAAARVLAIALKRDGVELRLATSLTGVAVTETGKQAVLLRDGLEERISVDEILVGAGRAPNVRGLDLEAAGVVYDEKRGVHVDDLLRTTNRRIYAAGDVSTSLRFTHTADAAARIVIQNALFPARKRFSRLTVPWCTYTSPEIAHVGLYEWEARERGLPIDTYEVPLNDVDRSIIDGETEGFVKIHTMRGGGRILGATIVGEQAGEMISELTLAMVAGVKLGRISNVIHPYPTRAEAIKKAADDYNIKRIRGGARRLLRCWFRWTR
jgi:pyruvate/2-oxoglutarate dehydrogenase complex dihydrolipoamide dehydrogenase (E3) component